MNDFLLNLFLKNKRLYYQQILQLVGNREDAQDVMQDVCVKIITRTPTEIRADRAHAYLTVICRHAALDVLRHREYTISLDQLPHDAWGAPDESLSLVLLRDILSRDISSLPQDVRRPLAECICHEVPMLRISHRYHIPRKKLRYWRDIFLHELLVHL